MNLFKKQLMFFSEIILINDVLDEFNCNSELKQSIANLKENFTIIVVEKQCTNFAFFFNFLDKILNI